MLQSVSFRALEEKKESSIRAYIGKNEFLIVGIVLVFFLILCACIQSRYIPWGDEVQFVDPAANLYDKLGFVSRQHSNQNDRTFWAANAPGYSTLLYVAFRMFHFSQVVARSLNFLTMAMAVLVLWIAVRRARFLAQPSARLLLVTFVLTGYGCYSCYANIRYDSLCFLECSLALLAFTASTWIVRDASLLFLGTGMALTNLQLPQYAVALILILTYAYSLRFVIIWRLRFLWLGFFAGGVSLFLLYASHAGSLQAFSLTLQQQAGQSFWEKLQDLPSYLEYDLSLAAFLLFLLVSFFAVRADGDSSNRKAITAGLLILTVIPALFFLARRFVFSSAWMVYVPAAMCVCRVIEAKIRVSRTWKVFAVTCCAMSIAFGLPKALAGIADDWAVRNYAVIDRFVAASVRKGDVVFCAPGAYFAAKPRVTRVYGPGYLDVISAAEKTMITVVIVTPADQAGVLRTLGGKWTPSGQLVRDSRTSSEKLLPLATNFSCRLNVLRRSSSLK